MIYKVIKKKLNTKRAKVVLNFAKVLNVTLFLLLRLLLNRELRIVRLNYPHNDTKDTQRRSENFYDQDFNK